MGIGGGFLKRAVKKSWSWSSLESYEKTCALPIPKLISGPKKIDRWNFIWPPPSFQMRTCVRFGEGHYQTRVLLLIWEFNHFANFWTVVHSFISSWQSKFTKTNHHACFAPRMPGFLIVKKTHNIRKQAWAIINHESEDYLPTIEKNQQHIKTNICKWW